MNKINGWVIWLTGLPASGKTTIAQVLQRKLKEEGIDTVLLDSDVIRERLKHFSYEKEGRDNFYKKIIEIAQEESFSGKNVIIAATGNKAIYRQFAREKIGVFIEVWIKSSIGIARKRDKERNNGILGLYEKADIGEITDLPGVNVEYEAPLSPDIVIDTLIQTPEEAAEKIISSVPFLDNRHTS